uniref:Uncharacterized protein n=1 Tax=Setaria italica TaxID=4555 RepID=K4AHZ1_SETIT
MEEMNSGISIVNIASIINEPTSTLDYCYYEPPINLSGDEEEIGHGSNGKIGRR